MRQLREAAVREERIKERTKSISQLREAERNADKRVKEDSRGDEAVDREREEAERRARSDILRRQRSQVSHCSEKGQRAINISCVFFDVIFQFLQKLVPHYNKCT